MGPGFERKYDTYAYRFVTQFNCYKHFFLTAFLLSHSTSCQSSPRVNTAKGSEESTGGEG